MADKLYEVKRIIEARSVNGQIEYLIRWKGYTEEYNSWEPQENLYNCNQLISRCLNKKRKRESFQKSQCRQLEKEERKRFQKDSLLEAERIVKIDINRKGIHFIVKQINDNNPYKLSQDQVIKKAPLLYTSYIKSILCNFEK